MCYLVLGWILTSWFMFCCQFWGHCRKYQISSWAAKYFSQELTYWQRYWERGYPISNFYPV